MESSKAEGARHAAGAGRARGLAQSWSLSRVVALASVAVLALASGVGLERFVLVNTAFGGQDHEALEDVEAYQTLADAYDFIREYYVLDEDMSDEELIYGATSGMLDALNDADHSFFMDPAETEAEAARMASQPIGIGLRVNWVVSPPQVLMPLEDTPAFEAGILPGDEIMTIDGVDPSTIRDVDDRSHLLAGEEGSEVVIELRHQGETETFEVTISRQVLELNPVSWAMLPGDILWVRLDGFPDGSAERMTEALETGNELGAKGVILDLRGNTGGWIDQAVAIAGEFQPAGSVVFEEEWEDGTVYTHETEKRNGEWQEGPLVVLTDERTASSGELLAATLKDNDRAILVGVTTIGLGTSVLDFPLPDGASMALSVALWTTPDGDVMLNEGISPHVEVRNGPGVFLTLPYMYEANELSENDIRGLDDVQLLVGYDVLVDMMEEAG